jgi:hypothetical protein
LIPQGVDARPQGENRPFDGRLHGWSTKGLPWQQLVTMEGAQDEAARFLDALNLA